MMPSKEKMDTLQAMVPEEIRCNRCNTKLQALFFPTSNHYSMEVIPCPYCSVKTIYDKEKEIQDLRYRVRDLESQIGASKKRKCCWCGHVFPADYPKSCPHCLHQITVEANAFEAGVSYEPDWPWR